MPTEFWTEINAVSIDEAAERIIVFLEDTSKETTVMYVNGSWNGLGTSAILKVVAKRLRSSPEKLRLDKIIHVDCSLWQSKRALQKAIAQELELPLSVMAMFDQHDEEDDFDGIEQGAREVIPRVTGKIMTDLLNNRLLVIFHNGSDGYIDQLHECGVPSKMGFLSKTLWTSQGRFRPCVLYLRKTTGARLSDVAIYVSGSISELLLHEEAKEVATYTGIPEPGMSPEIVKECIMYYNLLSLIGGNHGIDWATHAVNYWVCSGIIRSVGDTSAWEIAQALCTNLRLDWDGLNNKESLEDLRVPCDPYKEASFFWTTSASNNDTSTNHRESVEAIMLQHSSVDRLRVMHLSQCTFSFASPPFHCCSSLRFLLLDHCKDQDKLGSSPKSTSRGEDINKETSISSGACFHKLWVLDLSYTDWYWLLSTEALDLMADLRELNVRGVKHWSISHLCRRPADDASNNTIAQSSSKPRLLNLVKLHVTTDPVTEDQHQSTVLEDQVLAALFPNLSSSGILKTIILDGCVELEEIGSDNLPPLLESFSFSSSSNDNVIVSTKIESISFRGCTQLKNVLLRGLFQKLTQLDMSGTCIKTLDLRAMRGIWSLKRLFLLGCIKLRAILLPTNALLEVLHIDTTSSDIGYAAGVAESSSSPADFKWYISLWDGRLLRSLNNINYFQQYAHVEISSPPSESGGIIIKGRPAVIGGKQPWLMTTKSWQQQKPAVDNNKLYADVGLEVQHLQLQATISNYISCLQEETMKSRSLPPHLPRSMCERAWSLHVHDSLSVTSITSHSQKALKWTYLRWCRVGRCPNIEDVVFTPPSNIGGDASFWYLKTFWASQLAKARYIWDWGTKGQMNIDLGWGSFEHLEVLHVDCCPRLIHVLPLHYERNFRACQRLETLEIVCCGDLRDVFPVLNDDQVLTPREFPALRRIHLHDLPSLQRICGPRMVAPKLESVKIQGCWGLTSLPSLLGRDPSSSKPKVECEKDWWDSLQWDGVDAGHDPSLYEHTHSRYYKNKNLPRGSVLR